MSEADFIDEVVSRRGIRSNMDVQLSQIFKLGVPELATFTIEKKLMGINNIQYIAHLDRSVQLEFLGWMEAKNWKAKKDELDLWFSHAYEKYGY